MNLPPHLPSLSLLAASLLSLPGCADPLLGGEALDQVMGVARPPARFTWELRWLSVLLLALVGNAAQAAETDCTSIVGADARSREATLCMLEHPELAKPSQDAAPAVFINSERSPRWVDDYLEFQTETGATVQVRHGRNGASNYGSRVLVLVDWANPVLLDVEPGYWTHSPATWASASHLATLDLSDNGSKSQTVAVFDHRTGELVRRIRSEHRVEDVRLHDDILILRVNTGFEVWRASTGEYLWTVPDGTQRSLAASSDGSVVLVGGKKLYTRGEARPRELSTPTLLVGDHLYSVTNDGGLWKGAMSQVGNQPAGPERWSSLGGLTRGGEALVVNHVVYPAEATVPKSERPTKPGPDTLAALQTVTIEVQVAGPVALWQHSPHHVDIAGEGTLEGLDEAIRILLASRYRYDRTLTVTPDEPVRLELRSDTKYLLSMGYDEQLLSAMPGTTARRLHPHPNAKIVTALADRFSERRVRVRTANGSPVAGARLMSTGGMPKNANASGTFVSVVMDDEKHELWAMSDAGWSKKSADDTLVITEPRQHCRVADTAGTELIPATLCETIDLMPLGTLPVDAVLTRDSAEQVTLTVQPTVWLPDAPSHYTFDSSAIIDASGTSTTTKNFAVRGLTPGPATWRVELDDKAWCTSFEVGPLTTVIEPSFVRCE